MHACIHRFPQGRRITNQSSLPVVNDVQAYSAGRLVSGSRSEETFPSDIILDKATGAFRFCLKGLTTGMSLNCPPARSCRWEATLLLSASAMWCGHLIIKGGPYMFRYSVACISPPLGLSLHTVTQQHGCCSPQTCWPIYMTFIRPLPFAHVDCLIQQDLR